MNEPRERLSRSPICRSRRWCWCSCCSSSCPIATIVVVSFFDYNTTQIIPAFLLQNYEELLLSPVTWRTYLQTIQFALITWALTLVIGFTVAYFLAFHVRSPTLQTVLFLVCTIPFWTSNVIRMISWIPFLGRNGLANTDADASSA